ncbi:MAG: hypothetical protein ACT4OJ_03890 [Bacteroidota bacterium]
MFVKVKSSVFIDALHFQLSMPKGNCLRGVLKDDKGCVCRTLEKKVVKEPEALTWDGLNDLPYGKYTLELSQGEDESHSDQMKVNLVKRV